MQFIKQAADIPWDAAASLYECWDSKRHGRRWPAYGDFSAIDLVPWLSRLLVVERNPAAPNIFQFRIIGTMLTAIMEYDPTGSDVCGIAGGRVYNAHLLEAAEKGDPYIIPDQPSAFARKDYRRYRAISLPLSDDGVWVSGLMVMMDYLPRADQS